jgi:cell division transport system permease protein
MRPQLILSEAATGLRRNITMTVAAVLVIAIALSLFGIALLLRQQINVMKGFWYDKVEVSIFLCGDTSDAPSCADGAVTDTQRQQIQADLQATPQVDTVYYESKQKAFELFKEQFSDSAIVDNVTADSLPESFRVKLNNPETDYVIVASQSEGRPGIERVVDQREYFSQLFSVLNTFRLAALVVAGFALAAMVLLIVVVIRVAAFSRRRETGIMRLVGASNFSIQLPFLLEGAFAGLVGAVMAVGLLAVSKLFLVSNLSDKIQFTPFINWSDFGITFGILLALGVGLSGLISYLALLKYLRV